VSFPQLLSPLELRGKRLRNRIVFTAHTASFGQDGIHGERARAYYERRAAGGVGLIVLEPLPVHPTAGVTPQNYVPRDERFVPALRTLVNAIHGHGAVVVSQLYHLGANADPIATLRERWAPTAVAALEGPGLVREVDERDLAELAEGHVEAARRAVEAGVDGVECMFAYDTLVDAFMSPERNEREDRYGGSFENRMRLAVELLDALRETIGEERLLGVTLTSSLPGYVEAAAHLVEYCELDYVAIGNGNYEQSYLLVPPLDVEPGFGIARAAPVKAVLPGTAVVAEGRIVHPDLAERALDEGACDLVGMTRALIADPDLPRKTAEARLDEIRGCAGVNLCLARRLRKFPIACLQNPEAGFERLEHSAPARSRRLVVVGGGPAGLEAARVAALRGHDVTLLEREAELGGQVSLTARLPHQAPLAEIVSWRSREVDRLGVRVEREVDASADDVAALAPDLVLVATGSEPVLADGVVPAVDAISNGRMGGGDCVVIDDEGNRKGVGVAELIAGAGTPTTLVPNGIPPLADLVYEVIAPLALRRLREAGVRLVEGYRLDRFEPGRVVLRRLYDDSELALEAALVVRAGRHRARDGLVAELVERGIDARAIGDARAPRRVEDAIRDGWGAARSL
jgi:2,4-dienoyl-CoA reductase-like NADH-dependent reductase (Old Yellow Enzyme family)